MSIGSSYVADSIAVMVNGCTTQCTDAQVQAQFSGKTLTPTASFSFPWNGQIIQATQGDTLVVMPDLLAALSAAGAPFSQP